ncbi:hypothetical protein B0H16DRAFT_1876959 [Mycena metata]|uniref:Uncharacterized protein n=1 Tax=Mycena metata TaxID=1033252 RepID=A0AAD7KFF1_9AGAR|nr:hypothetical protein B0H16DRAFT_1876959 [Mycena metata]
MRSTAPTQRLVSQIGLGLRSQPIATSRQLPTRRIHAQKSFTASSSSSAAAHGSLELPASSVEERLLALEQQSAKMIKGTESLGWGLFAVGFGGLVNAVLWHFPI